MLPAANPPRLWAAVLMLATGLAGPAALADTKAQAKPAPARSHAASGDVKAGVDAWSRGDYEGAVRQWQGPADKGDPDAQFNLGQAYKMGRGVPQDLAKAELLYAKAAAQGHLQASDNYGLLLHQRGQHAAAMPYIEAAADRGDPRAQYLLGLSFFNADGVGKDWVRAYALVSLAAQPPSGAPGVAPAQQALAQMDQYIPLPDRQRAVSLAANLAAQADANRQRQLTAADLGTPQAPVSAPRIAAAVPSAAARTPVPAMAQPPKPRIAPAVAPAATLREAAPPALEPAPPPAAAVSAPASHPAPAPKLQPQPKPAPARPAPTPAAKAPALAAERGSWKLQLGAFGVAANADAQWAHVKARPEITGHARQDAPTGKVHRLLATGYSQAGAQAACHSLAAAGISCLAVRD